MNVIALRTIRQFWDAHPDSETPLRTWYAIASNANWQTPQDIKDQFGVNVDFVGDNRAVFDIGGNKYRMVVHVSYTFGNMLVKFIGTHKEYDAVSAENVDEH